ncbi:chemotaxis protein CheB [Desulfofarcimen acetoxidans]|uniref:chemotaxis protein CheB n=1 Tax=Desulfofarcimen acetoxidans TaxID=58138 RepID=UPI0009FEC7F5
MVDALKTLLRRKKYIERSLNTSLKEKRVYQAVVIGVSAGGFAALSFLLPSLPEDFSLPVIIVQHLHPASGSYIVQHLNNKCSLIVKQADEKESIKPGTVYLASPNYHLLVEEDRTFSLTVDNRVNYARPSIDVLFETAARAYGEKLIGIILTGSNNDGSKGLKRIKEGGGLAVVQDPLDAEVDSMPRAALAATAVDFILSLEQIASFLMSLSKGKSYENK